MHRNVKMVRAFEVKGTLGTADSGAATGIQEFIKVPHHLAYGPNYHMKPILPQQATANNTNFLSFFIIARPTKKWPARMTRYCVMVLLSQVCSNNYHNSDGPFFHYAVKPDS